MYKISTDPLLESFLGSISSVDFFFPPHFMFARNLSLKTNQTETNEQNNVHFILKERLNWNEGEAACTGKSDFGIVRKAGVLEMKRTGNQSIHLTHQIMCKSTITNPAIFSLSLSSDTLIWANASHWQQDILLTFSTKKAPQVTVKKLVSL